MSFKLKNLADKKPICYIFKLFDELSSDVYSYGSKRSVRNPNVFVVSYAISVILFCVSLVVGAAAFLFSVVDSYEMAILVTLLLVLLVCLAPFLSMFALLYYGGLFVLATDFLLTLITCKFEKFKKCVPYISFYLGGLLGLILPILIIIIKG